MGHGDFQPGRVPHEALAWEPGRALQEIRQLPSEGIQRIRTGRVALEVGARQLVEPAVAHQALDGREVLQEALEEAGYVHRGVKIEPLPGR